MNYNCSSISFKLKRLTDILISLTVLTILSPLFILIPILIVIDSKGPAFYFQKRVGQNEVLFNIIKFRTMFIGTPEVATDLIQQHKNPITRIGYLLRKTSLDELPQLINVLLGQMSLVGPRPCLYNQYELIEKRKANNIFIALPGITGLAQINGRDDLSDDIKVNFDKQYVTNWNYFLDWQIIFGTFSAVLTRKGVY